METQLPRWDKSPWRDATLIFVSCGLLNWLSSQVVNIIGQLLEASPRDTWYSAVIIGFLVGAIASIAAFTLAGCFTGGSRKSRFQYLRRVFLFTWLLDCVVRAFSLLLLSVPQEMIGPPEYGNIPETVDPYRALNTIRVLAVFGFPLSFLGLLVSSLLGGWLSFRFVPEHIESAPPVRTNKKR